MMSEEPVSLEAEVDVDGLQRLIADLNSSPPSIEIAVVAVKKASLLLKQMKRLHHSLTATFSSRFPDLSSLIPEYEIYARVASFLAVNSDLSPELRDLLTQQQFVALHLGLSTNLGPPISDPSFIHACDLQIQFSSLLRDLNAIASSSVSIFAPNICALIGPELSARLISFSGGLQELSSTPACNIKLFGAKKGGLMGFSSRSAGNHHGILYDCDLVQQTPPEFRDSVFRDIANKIALACRVDCARQFQDGSYGSRTREEMQKRLDKKMNNQTPKFIRPLPIPGLEKKSNRGGRQKRANKKKFGMGEELTARSRVQFGIGGQFDDLGVQFGATALEGFRRQNRAVDAPFQAKIDKKLKHMTKSAPDAKLQD
jgi:U4/U6 small nuclear ribonucleoprotein PRP31